MPSLHQRIDLPDSHAILIVLHILMLLVFARPAFLAACLYFLPHAIIDTSDDTGALPVPTSATTNTPVKRDWRPLLSRTVFAWTFTESSMLFVLLVCQATNTFSASQRAANFQFSLYALLVIHIILIPQSIALLVLSPTAANLLRLPRTILSSFIPVFISLILLSYIPTYTIQSDPPFLTRTLSRLIVLGTTILGLLSGFGAVTRAWDFLPSSVKQTYDVVPAEEEIHSTETSLQSVQNDLQRKQDELSRQLEAASSSTNGTSGTSASWMKRVGDTLRGGDDCAALSCASTICTQFVVASDIGNQGASNAPSSAHSHSSISTRETRFFKTSTHTSRPAGSLCWTHICGLLCVSNTHGRHCRS
jgi:hypothetical protein